MSPDVDTDQNQKVAHSKKLAYSMKSEAKRARKQALVELERYLSNSEENFTQEDFHDIFNEIQMYALNGIRDKSEPVREQAIKFTRFLILDKLFINDYYLSYVFPILLERLGSVEIIEESEEIRFQLIQFMEAIILKYSQRDQLKPFLKDMTQILCETVKDKYPSIKETSCKCIILLAKALPRDFNLTAESLIKPVLTAFGHQRFKIRVEAIKCVGELVMHSTYKGLEDVLTPMAERLFDQIPIVRRTVAQVTARWLLEYRDRYSFFQKLLPLILTGLIDEVPETRTEAHRLWEVIGLQYERENEEDLKDQINFLNEDPKYYVENLKRPNLGCRVLVQRHVSKMVSALSNELTSWQVDVRIRCSQLLCAVLLHTESGITQSLQGILPAMYSTARDEDNRVVINIIQASELLGLFVSYNTWKKLVLVTIEDGPHYGHLTVLAGLIRGAPKECIEDHLEEIAKILADESICWSRKAKYQREMLSCVNAILPKLPNSPNALETGKYLFVIAVSLISLKDKDNTDLEITLLDKITEALGLKTTLELWSVNLGELLRLISKDPKAWTLVTSERCIFETILLESGAAFGENLQVIGDILIKALDVDAEPESRLKTFMALSKAFKSKENIFKKSESTAEFLERLATSVFVPSLVWRAGATAEAMRTMAASCLFSALNPSDSIDLFKSTDVLKPLWEKLLPLLISLAEDASSRSRALALENLVALKQLLTKKNVWKNEDLVKVYPEIVKRLDDPTDAVRICAIKALAYIFDNPPNEFKSVTFKGHHELLLDTLLTHFDDDDDVFQENALSVFKVLGGVCREVMIKKINKHRPILRNQQGCNQILESLEELKI